MSATPTPTAVIESNEEGGLTVWAEWPGVDRPRVHGISVRTQALADRLAAAINAGAVYADIKLATDVNGATYIAARSLVMGRHLNADLRKLGF